MYWLLTLMSLSLFAMIATGIYYELYPQTKKENTVRRLKGAIAINLLTFIGAQIGLIILGIQDVMADQVATVATREVSLGMGLAMLGIGLPTGLAAFGAGLAVGPVGAASLATIAEKPEIFGRTLVYLGLAEGIAIYGLVVTILMLGKI